MNKLRQTGPPGQIQRHQYYSRDYVTRNISFDTIRALDISRHGKKVQLSDKTVQDLVMVRLPDPNDKTYLQEGRKQRTKLMRVDINNNLLPLKEKLAAIEAAIAQGVVASEAQSESIIESLVNIVDSNKNLGEEIKQISSIVLSLNINESYKTLIGDNIRFIDKNYIDDNGAGTVMIYSMNRLKILNRTTDNLFYYVTSTNDTVPISLKVASKTFDELFVDRYLDLETLTFVTEEYAAQFNQSQAGSVAPDAPAGTSDSAAYIPPSAGEVFQEEEDAANEVSAIDDSDIDTSNQDLNDSSSSYIPSFSDAYKEYKNEMLGREDLDNALEIARNIIHGNQVDPHWVEILKKYKEKLKKAKKKHFGTVSWGDLTNDPSTRARDLSLMYKYVSDAIVKLRTKLNN